MNYSFGEILKNYREAKNMSLSELHRKTGVSQPYLSQLENGKKPSKKIIFKLLWGLCEDEPKEFIGMYGILMDVAGYEVKTEDTEILEQAMIEYSTLFKEINYIEAQIALLQNRLKWTKLKEQLVTELEILNLDLSVRVEQLEILKKLINQYSKPDKQLEIEINELLTAISEYRESNTQNIPNPKIEYDEPTNVNQLKDLIQIEQQNKDERDIAKRLEQLRQEIENSDDLAFDGEPLSDEAKESLIESMEYIFKQTKKINKKYTPKK